MGDSEISEVASRLQERIMRMTERHDARKATESKRRRERYDHGSVAQQTEVFTEVFRDHKIKIEQALHDTTEASFAGENRSELSIRMDDVFKIIESLKKYMTESSMFLTPFDNEQARNDLQSIMNNFNKVRDTVLPQKKFGFGSKVKRLTDKTQDEPIKQTPSKPISTFKSETVENQLGFAHQTGKILQLKNHKLTDHDICLTELIDCRILLLPGNPGSLYLRNIKNCTIVSGPVSRSLFVENCSNCKIYLACQQARIHGTSDSDFYLHLTSSAVTIENCSSLRFAPYLVQYDELDADFFKSCLDRETNNWNKVDDFRHLVSGVASPNWSIIPEDDRKAENNLSCENDS